MNIDVKFENTQEQVQLVQAMASKDPSVAMAAREAFAKLLSITIGKFYQQADTTKSFFKDMVYREEDGPDEIPLELYTSVDKGHFTVTSSAMPGGLPTNQVYEAPQYARFTPYRYDSAIAFLEKYARKANLDVVGAGIQRLMQEVLLKTNNAAWQVMLSALANARYSASVAGAATNIGQVFESTTADILTLDDLNKLFTSFRRINSSWNRGTPVNGSGKPTDVYLSPELIEQIRGMAYQPVNTVGANRSAITAGTDASAGGGIALPDAQRQAIFNAAGTPSFFGVSFNELLELGIGQEYEVIFDAIIGSATLPKVGTTTGSGTFASGSDELLIVTDNSKAGGVRAIATDSDTGSVFKLESDDQFVKRSKKIGFYGGVEESRLWLESRSIVGLVV